ncbi:PILR alpha-associated neural protein, partial [Tachysurus ichikawai]
MEALEGSLHGSVKVLHGLSLLRKPLQFSVLELTFSLCWGTYMHYDRSLSQRPPPLSLAIPCSLAQEDSRHTLQSTPSFPDRE